MHETPARIADDANARVSRASSADLAYFLQERGLCAAFCDWYDEKPPIQRLLEKSKDARAVGALLVEGKKRGWSASATFDTLRHIECDENKRARDSASEANDLSNRSDQPL